MIQKCFLTEMTSDQMLLHRLRIYDPIQQSVDNCYISDYAFNLFCEGSDEVVADMWIAWKQAYSSGYTDSGFIRQLEKDCDDNTELFCLIEGEEVFLAIEARILSFDSSFGTLICKTTKPIQKKSLAKSALSMLRKEEHQKGINWQDDRYAIRLNNKIQNSAATIGLMNSSILQYGNPPDLFLNLAANQTAAGFELLRRICL